MNANEPHDTPPRPALFVRRVDLHTAPGLKRGLQLDELGPGVVLLVGRNASGKSTLGRVIGTSLWDDKADDNLHASSSWQVGADTAEATVAVGRVHWAPARPACPAGGKASWHLSVAELLQSASGTDSAIARSIQQQLSGGYDLPAARATFAGSVRPAGALTTALRNAQTVLRNANAGADALKQDEVRLGALEAQLEGARAADRALARARTAKQLVEARADLTAARAKLDRLPPDLDRLHGDEDRRLVELRAEAETASTELDHLERQLASGRAEEARCAFAAARPDLEQLARWRDVARRCEQASASLIDQRRVLAAVRAEETERAQQVFAESAVPSRLDAADLAEVERAVRGVHAARAAATEAKEAAKAIPRRDTASDVRALEEAVAALRDWLAIPWSSQALARPARWPWLCLVAGALILVVAGLRAHPLLATTGAIAFAIGLVALYLGQRRSASDDGDTRRAEHRRRFERLGLAGPEAWTTGAVESRFNGLVDDLVAAREDGHWFERGRELATRVRRANETLDAALGALDNVCDRLGLAADWPDLAILQQSRRLDELAKARAATQAAVATYKELEAELADALGQASTWLASLNRPPAGDAATLTAALDAIAAQLAALTATEREIAASEEQFATATERRKRVEDRIASLFAACGLTPNDADELRTRLGELDTWGELTTETRELGRTIERLCSELADAPDWLDATSDEIDAREAAAHDLAARRDTLAEELARIRQAITTASTATLLADARGAVEAGREALVAARARAAEDEIGRRLADWLRDQVSDQQTPAVLRRARTRLVHFTRSAFDVDVDPIRGFVATDLRDQRRLALDQLSDATRMQLLLAARLAWLEQAEGDGPSLPLFLDEVLSTTDPERFAAVAGVLLDLGAAGRQIIYATADRDELRAWQRLAAERDGGTLQLRDLDGPRAPTSWPVDCPATPTPVAAPPPLDGKDATTYAEALGLVPPTRRDAPASWHLIHLLGEDLPALRRLLEAGITTVGQLLELERSGLAVIPLEPARRRRVVARAQLLVEVVSLDAIGRNRPITWDDVAATAAVTASFDVRARALVAEHGADAGAWLDAFAALPRVNQARVDVARAALVERGLISEDEVLGVDELVMRTAAACAAAVDEGLVTVGEVRAMTAWVRGILASKPQKPQ